jgi:hypothetical protein
VQTVTTTDTNVVLTVSNSTNISSLDCFNFSAGCQSISDVVTGTPLPVQIIVNGVAISLLNKYSLPILSNRVPCRSRGAYVAVDGVTPYVILFDTPYRKCNA